MDSRLLNVFHDDPFDGNYGSFDQNNWIDDCHSISMELTDTLQGILPISLTELQTPTLYDNILVKDEISEDDQIYNDFTGDNSSLNLLVKPSTELFSDLEINSIVAKSNDGDDGNDKYEDDDDAAGDNNDSDDDDDVDDSSSASDINESGSEICNFNLDAYDSQSFGSGYTFRTRTDSSSIGDYESHSSDYEDDGLGLLDNLNYKIPIDVSNFNSNDNRRISVSTADCDVDDLNIAGNNFDLAEFITKEDFKLELNARTQQRTDLMSSAVVQIISSKNIDSDSDSDVIVDVETVECETEDVKTLLKSALQTRNKNEIFYIDDIKGDPSWSPTHKSRKADTVAKESKKRIVNHKPHGAEPWTSLVHSKKIAPERGKDKVEPINTNVIGENDHQIHVTPSAKQVIPGKLINGIGQGGKNMSLLKRESQHECEKLKEETCLRENKYKYEQPVQEQQAGATQIAKRILNLEEYKKRRLENNINTTSEALQKSEKDIKDSKPSVSNADNSIPNNALQQKHSEAVTNIVRSLKEQTNKKSTTDPITEAKNKVLRMQQLKKAQQIKIIDSTVSAKVPRVTKVLPLKEIVKDTYCKADCNTKNSAANELKKPTEYKEIVVVSASSNTDISIPPCQQNTTVGTMNQTTIRSRSLLKSTALLNNISHTFQKVQSSERAKLSCNSLIVSIQDVVVKKAMPLLDSSAKFSKVDTTKEGEHGEDKTIIHLLKDTISKSTLSMATQTDIQAEFPPLTLLKSKVEHNSRNKYRKRRHNSSDSSEDSDSNTSYGNCNRRSIMPTSYRSPSRSTNGSNSSAERARQFDVNGGYSSRSSRRHRSSVSSSFSESERKSRSRRHRKTSYTHRMQKRTRSSSMSSNTDRSVSRTRSRSPHYHDRRERSNSRSISPTDSRGSEYKHNQGPRSNVQPAVEERRIVYVGRIEAETNKDMLRRKFQPYGSIKQISIHYKETGMKYGFVTYERSQDAFAVIDNSSRDVRINMYDISFGGRRAFCRSSYADLDNAGINNYHSVVYPQSKAVAKEEDSFEALLQKVKQKMNANRLVNNQDSKM